METIYIIFILLAAALGAFATWFVIRNQHSAMLAQHAAMLTQQQQANEQRIADLKEQHTQQLKSMESHCSQRLIAEQQSHSTQLNDLRQQHTTQLHELRQQHATQLHELRQQHAEQLEQQMALIKEQMNTASERILKERSEQLSQNNREQLSSILTPLQTNIQQMREAVEKSSHVSSTTMERLDATIKQSIEQSREVGERADKLAQALTGENKTQGNFGELRLKQMLEEMGLEEGVQFEEQTTMRDKDGNVILDEEDGRRMIPDVILHFPDERDIIIDSKMSFTAFERYHNTDDEAESRIALQQHIASMRKHVNELSQKNYSKYIKEGRGKLDFVLMYVFSESALQLALSNDTTLWKEAYDRGVIITGSQNLYALLRVLGISWKQVRQVENQQRIMECANSIIDRVQMFVERFDVVQQQLSKTQDAFDKLSSITADGGQSIVTPARQLIKMGAKENPKRKKSLSQGLAEQTTNAE